MLQIHYVIHEKGFDISNVTRDSPETALSLVIINKIYKI